jgi:regulation of enolase protein 1 (concanavalin A-like superfamily)
VDGSGGPTTPPPPPASTALPDGWLQADIGAVGVMGNAMFDAATGTYTVSGGGADVWGTADAFHFAYTTLTGDGSVTARVTNVSSTAPWVKAGVMIRGSVAANAAHGFMLVSYSKGLAFQRRPADGGTSLSTAGVMAAAPYWVRVVRAGNLVTAFQSADGTNWVQVGSETIALGSATRIGLAVSSHTTAAAATATFDNVQFTGAVDAGSSTPPPPPQSALPDGWVNQDIGAVGAAGSSSYDAGSSVFTVKGAGADVWGTADAFQYAYTAITGNGSITARVLTTSNTAAWVKAGVMIRGSLSPSAAQGFMLVSWSKGLAFQRRTVDGGLSTSTAGTLAAAPYWVRVERVGDVITASQSADGVTWTVVDSDTIPMSATVYVGLAVSSHTTAKTATATFDNVSIVQGTSTEG